MSNNPLWTTETDEALIQLVKHRRGLYDINSPLYSNNDYKKKAWREIELELKINGAKNRWEQLRAQYRSYLNKVKRKSGKPSAKVLKWRFSERMKFIDDFLNFKNSKSSTLVFSPEFDNSIDEMCTWNLTDEKITYIDNKPKLYLEKSDTIEYDERLKAEIKINYDEVDKIEVNYDLMDEIKFCDNPEKIFLFNTPKKKNIATTSKAKITTVTLPKKNQSTSKESKSEQKEAAMTINKSASEMQCNSQTKAEEQDDNPIDHFFSLMATTVKKFSVQDQFDIKQKVFALVSQTEKNYL